MTLALLAAGAGLLAFPTFGHRVSLTRPPREWARIAAAALLSGSVAVELSLLLTALPTVLSWLQLEGFAQVCHPFVDEVVWRSGGPVLGWLAFVLAAVPPAVVFTTVRRSRRLAAQARIEPWVGAHQPRGAFEVVLVPTPAVLALSVPAAVPQVIVSDGAAARLSRPHFEAVIAHEAAHLRFHHRQYVLIATVAARAFGALPYARKSARALQTAVEEWADEEAALGPSTRRSDLCSALRALAPTLTNERLCATAERRLWRLERQPEGASPGRRLLGYSPLLGLLGLSVTLALGWLAASHHVVAFWGYCPKS